MRAGSRAVLIGTATYTHPDLTAIPAAVNNLFDLERVLTSEAGGAFDPRHCTVLADPQSGSQIGDAIALAAGQATGVLLVYYTGHGVLDNRGRLHLAVSGTDPSRPAWTSVSFQTLREEILESPSESRIVILDCCFAGRAFEAMSDTATVIAAETSIQGTYTIVSSGANETSFAPVGHRNTAFTAALLATAATSDLTLDELYRQTARHLVEHGHPRPRRRAIDTAGELKLFGRTGDHRSHLPIGGSDTTADDPDTTADDPDTTYDQGCVAHQQGDLARAERMYRRAAEAGHAAGMNGLGVVLQERGELTQAEPWYRRAADLGDTNAMNNIGFLLYEREDLINAETWFYRAMAEGNTDGTNNLGHVYRRRGDISTAETLWRRAAEAGNTNAMDSLGTFLTSDDPGRNSEAETWLRRAADAGNISAMRGLADLLAGRGALAEADDWRRRAAAHTPPI